VDGTFHFWGSIFFPWRITSSNKGSRSFKAEKELALEDWQALNTKIRINDRTTSHDLKNQLAAWPDLTWLIKGLWRGRFELILKNLRNQRHISRECLNNTLNWSGRIRRQELEMESIVSISLRMKWVKGWWSGCFQKTNYWSGTKLKDQILEIEARKFRIILKTLDNAIKFTPLEVKLNSI